MPWINDDYDDYDDYDDDHWVDDHWVDDDYDDYDDYDDDEAAYDEVDYDDAPWPDPEPTVFGRVKRLIARLRWRWYAWRHKGGISDFPL